MKLVVLLFALLLIGIAFAPYTTSSAYSTFGKSVSLNLAFNISGRAADNLTNGNDFVAASSSTLVLGIAANAFGTRYDVNYSSDEYIIESRTPLRDARFFLAFTRGNSSAITSKLDSVKSGIVGRTFGDFNLTIPRQFDIFLRLEYRDVNILNRMRLGPGSRKIEIRNEGMDDKEVTNVTLDVIR